MKIVISGKYIVLLFCSLVITGCANNPVTGKRESSLISTQQEIQMGQENYAPLKQSEGGHYELDPALTRYVQSVGNKLAAVSDRKLPYEFSVINSSVPNAWALPGGKIGVNRGLLLELNSEAELAAVLSHEIVHAAARHSAQKMERSMALNLGLVLLGATQSDSESGQLLMAGGMIGAQLLNQSYSRHAESEADKFGIKYMVQAGYDPIAAVELQETFVRLSNGKQQNWLSGLFASHPPSQERVDANRQHIRQYNRKGLTLNKNAYQNMIAGTKKNQKAYASYEKAGEALQKKNYKEAMTLANQAISIEKREALFYALKGDIYALQKQNTPAIQQYNQAIKLNNDLFYFYLRRGLTYKAQGKKSDAKMDLEKSMKLLPTKQADTALKELN